MTQWEVNLHTPPSFHSCPPQASIPDPGPSTGILVGPPWRLSPPQPDKALMGVRIVGDEPFLFAKSPWRKNMASGRIPRRPCFCSLANRRAALICPVHVFWHLIRCRVAPGQPIFAAVNPRNCNRILKTVLSLSKLRTPEE